MKPGIIVSSFLLQGSKEENESFPKLNKLVFFCNRNQSIFALFKLCVIYQGIEFPRRSGGCRISIGGKQTKEHEL